MLLRLSKPSRNALQLLVERAGQTEPTYPELGATANELMPAGYRHDLYERPLGSGAEVFRRAESALRRWQAHIGAGVEVFPMDAPLAENESFLLVLRLGAVWTIAPCRIIYVTEGQNQFSFAYGTLPGHPEIGEAAFTVSSGERDATFRIRSFSRPADVISRIGAPISRRVQTAVPRRYLDALTRAATDNSAQPQAP